MERESEDSHEIKKSGTETKTDIRADKTDANEQQIVDRNEEENAKVSDYEILSSFLFSFLPNLRQTFFASYKKQARVL